jgi:REP element-mobilizing transposase RayT
VKNGSYPSFDKHIWQRNYYEHIIRNEQDYQEIWDYIDTNPMNRDEEH